MSGSAKTALTLGVPEELVEAIAERVAELIAEGPAKTEPSPWLDVGGAAAYLACSRQRICDLASSGRLRYAKDGRRSLFRREWLDAYLEDAIL